MAGAAGAGRASGREDAAPLPAVRPVHEEQLRLPDLPGPLHRHQHHPDCQAYLRLP